MKYPIYPIAFSYVSGIFCSHYFGLSFSMSFGIVTISFLLLLFLYFTQLNKGFLLRWNTLTIVTVCIVFSALGSLIYKINNPKIVINDLNTNEFTVKVREVLKSNKYAHRAYADLISHKNHPKVVLSFPSKNTLPKVGNVYKIVGTIKKIPAPQNLYDFNYKNYLQHKQIYYQITTYQSPVKIAQTKSFYSVVINVRNYLVSQFTKLGYNAKTKGFIEALLFGVKTNLNDELQCKH